MDQLPRRRALAILGGAGLATLVSCSSSSSGDDAASGSSSSTSDASSRSSTSTSADATGASCAAIPEETAGPFPGDGSNGPDILTADGVVRRDITRSFGGSTTAAEGVPLEIELTVLSISDGCSPLEGAAIYLWHCDRDGGYSMYGDGLTDENYLRGVAVADADGVARFTSIFPGCYPGRWPHLHFEIYRTVDDATGGGSKLRTTQLAFPRESCEAAYAADGYDGSLSNLGQLDIDRDMVFSDGYSLQLGKVTGSIADGYTVTLSVPV